MFQDIGVATSTIFAEGHACPPDKGFQKERERNKIRDSLFAKKNPKAKLPQIYCGSWMQNLILPRTADHSTEHLDIAGSDPSATSNNLISFLAIWWTFIKAGGVPWQAPSLQVRETDFRRTVVLATFLRYLKARSRHLHNMRKLHQR